MSPAASSRSAHIVEALTHIDRSLVMKVKGHCMHPLIREGERVRIEPQTWYWPGDVLAVVRGGHQIALHRCIGYVFLRGAWCVLTQADRESTPDRATPFNHIVGRAVAVDAPTQRILNTPLTSRLTACTRGIRWFSERVTRRFL